MNPSIILPTVTALLIDDERNSREALRKKLELFCPQVQILAECSDGAEGIAAIEQLDPEVIFLDIEMPRMNGFAMLQQLPAKRFEIIFTTAYNQYAIEAVRCSAFDYLVKPVDANELVAAMQRIAERPSVNNQTSQQLEVLMQYLVKEKSAVQKIAVATLEGIELIAINELLYLEATGNYTHLHRLDKKPLLASKTLKDFEDILPPQHFCRIHNASIVNIQYIQRYTKGDGGSVLLTNGVQLDVARRRKEELLHLLAKLSAKV